MTKDSSQPRAAKPRVLCIDDEPHALEALSAALRGHFDVETVVGGRRGVETLINHGPYAVVVTDLHMPEVDGVAVLKAAREHAPDTTRILITGHADFEAAVAAVNDGHVFRFLIKPCPPDQVRSALNAAVEQERLLRAEHELLEQTLKGALKLCIDILALVHPQALSRATRVRRIAALLAQRVTGADNWAVEVAALLAHIGAVTLPAAVVEKLHTGGTLTLGEIRQTEQLPLLGAQLVSDIPRLEPVGEILRFQRTWFDGTHSPERGIAGERIPLGARILMIADDYDVLEAHDLTIPARLRVLEGRVGMYDPSLLHELRDVLTRQHDTPTGDDGHVMRLEQVQVGMCFAEDVTGPNGLTLIGRGQEVTVALIERIRVLSAIYRERIVKMTAPRRPL